MESIGQRLQEAREQLGLTLDEVERGTRIRTYHLEAMERGEFESLPSPVQARGFLHNYAEFLGLDSDALLLQFANNLQSQRKQQNANVIYGEPATRPSVEVRSSRSRWLSSDIFVAGGITLIILVMLVWGGSSLMASLGENSPRAEEIEDLLIPSVTISSPENGSPLEGVEPIQATPVSTEPSLIPTQAIIIGPTNQVILQLVIEKRAWLSVIVDGEEQFPGHRATVGQLLEFQGEEKVEVSTGNGAGVRVFFNGQDQGLMGGLGQVVTRVWTISGVLTPTPTQTSTPSLTPVATETPEITPTLEPTSETEGG
jgi:transcriptional regulator with XRE-family HTH domain